MMSTAMASVWPRRASARARKVVALSSDGEAMVFNAPKIVAAAAARSTRRAAAHDAIAATTMQANGARRSFGSSVCATMPEHHMATAARAAAATGAVRERARSAADEPNARC